MRIVAIFGRVYPRETLIALVALLFAGIAEGVSLSAIWPLLAIGLPGESPTPGEGETARLVADAIAAMGLTPTLGVMLALMAGCLVLKAALLLFANRQIGYLAAHVATDLRRALVEALLATRWQHFVHQPLGNLANAVSAEARRSSMAFRHGIMLIAMGFQIVAATVVALLVSWPATLACLAAGAFITFAMHGFVRKAERAGAQQTKHGKSMVARLTDSLQAVKALKAMGREQLADSMLSEDNRQLHKAMRRKVFSKQALRSLHEPLLGVIVAIGIYLAITVWDFPFASIIVMVILLERIVQKMGRAQRHYQDMVIAESAYWSLQQTLGEAEGAREVESGDAIPTLERDIRLEEVSFAYETAPILDGISIEARAGELTCLVGASGAGKTTVIDMVTGLLRPDTGRVLIDGVDLNRVDMQRWRRMIGYVPQESLLLNDTLAKNVTLGDETLTDEDVERALKDAAAEDLVRDLPEGIHTRIGERGTRFSGGQRQRIALARALVHRPRLLVLDEATSALDAASEAGIVSTLTRLRGSVTMLAIAHTTALVEASDQVIRLAAGRVVPGSSGGHPEGKLLETG